MAEIDCKKLFDDLPDGVKSTLPLLAEKVKKGEVILFLGAAIHMCPPEGYDKYCIDASAKDIYTPDHRPPTGTELANMLAEKVNYKKVFPDPNSFNLGMIAQYYEINGGRDALISFLQEKIDNKTPSPIIHALSDLPFKYMLTTNYDNLYEDALVKRGKAIHNKGIYHPNKNCKKTTIDFNESEVTEQTPFIYKMHGDIKDVATNSMSDDEDFDSIVLTDEDYIHFILRMNDKDNYNPIPFSFTKSFGKKSILFVGYGLMDYNLRLLLKSTMWGKDIRNRIKNWAVNKYPNEVIVWLSEPYSIKFIVEDSWLIVPALYWLVKQKNMPLIWTN